MPLDIVGGASMGAIVAAGVALEWDDTEMKERLHSAFVKSNPFGELALPLIALFKGTRVTRLLKQHFGNLH